MTLMKETTKEIVISMKSYQIFFGVSIIGKVQIYIIVVMRLVWTNIMTKYTTQFKMPVWLSQVSG